MEQSLVVAGAGSIGTVLGLLLAREGNDVTLLRRRGPFGETMINMVGVEEFKQEINISQKIERRPDVIFITVQEQQMNKFCQELSEKVLFDDSTILVSLQNGIKAPEVLTSQFPDNPILSGAIWWSAALLDTDRVLYHRQADTVIGIPQGSIAKPEHLEHVIKVLNVLDARPTDDIGVELKKKLILNVVSPVLALVKQPYPEGLQDIEVREMVHALFDEALETADLFDWNVDEEDPRLLNFHIRLAETGFPRNASPNLHKVSTQLGIEKYGGRSSNVHELLGWLQLSGSILAHELVEWIERLETDYEPVSLKEIAALLNSCNFANCRLERT